MDNDYTEFLTAIIEIGMTGLVPRPIAEERQRIEESGINRESPGFWTDYCASLSVEQSIDLFKGLVIVERELRLSGGSVSGNIWVLKCLDKRIGPNEIFDLIDWAFEHRHHLSDYTPLGAAIQKVEWKEIDRNVFEMRQGNFLDSLRSRAVNIRKQHEKNGRRPAP